MLTAHGNTSQEAGLLRAIGEQLINRGLRVRERVRGGELTEIESANPRDPAQSRVIIGCDGFLIWERWYRLRTDHDAHTIAQVASTLLDQNISHQSTSQPANGNSS
jgi:hypothetical protein